MTTTASAGRTLVIWHISDGRRGHDNQCLGLIQALQQLRACQHYVISAPAPTALIPALFRKRFAPGDGLPDPDLIIGAGHGTHAAMLCARRARRGRTVVLMRPSLPLHWFDVCLIPAHDEPPVSGNVIRTEGVLTRVVPAAHHCPGKGLMLIGGPSKHYSWDQGRLLAQINRIAETAGTHWLLSDSPRTPPATSQALATLKHSNIEFISYLNTDDGWLPERLAEAWQIWITADSISMIYEALTSGGAVGLLHVPQKRNSRITRIPAQLNAKKMVTTYAAWVDGKSLSALPEVCNEARRCAELLLSRFSF